MAIFGKSKNFKQEYCCSIIKVDNITPIPDSDFLGIVNVAGFSIVVRKDQVHVGDIVFYASNETQLADKFLKANNLYQKYELNSNANEVYKLLQEGKTDEAKKKCGFFNQTGRVRTIKLRKVQSFGFIFKLEELQRAYNIPNINLDEYVGTDFDLVNDEMFIKAYIPPIKTPSFNNTSKTKKATKKANEIDRIIPGEFTFHYDTQPLGKNLDRLKVDDVITLSVKLHGTSAIFGNVKSNIPNKLPWYKKFINLFGNIFPKSHVGYSEIYSSRTVIKNRWANPKSEGYYSTDIWGEYAKLLEGKIPEGMTIYGEIIGYLSGSSSYIQKDYDYGCKPGTNKLMIYRINIENKDGITHEWNISEVHKWTLDLIKKNPEIADRIHPIDTLYHGKLSDFVGLDISHHWQENFLNALSQDKDLGMEQNEPLCKNKVPREGLVLRIDDDPIKEAFKLKCVKFLTRESKQIDSGQVDMEMQNTEY